MTHRKIQSTGGGTGVDIQSINRNEAELLCTWLVTENRCREARVLADGSVAATQDLLFTRSIVVGCHGDGWAQRYCFEDRALADLRFKELESEEDVPEGHIATRQGVRPLERPKRPRRCG